MKHLIAFILLWCGMSNSTAFCQVQEAAKPKTLAQHENGLMASVDSMNRIAVLDERIEFCHDFIKKLSAMLKEPKSFDYPFETLSKKVHIIYPEDKSFRIFNWPVEYAPARFRYYGAIQRADGKVFPLLDHSDKVEDLETKGLMENKNWYGQEYYRILTQKAANGQTIYFLLGVNHNNLNTSVKVLEPMTFKGDQVVFGGDYFQNGRVRKVIEYQKGAQVSFNWDAERGMVIYNVLESEVNQPKRKHTMVPNGEIDGLKWNGSQWVMQRNLVPIMKLKDGQAPVNGVIPTN
jgi:hypothetical protein